MNAKSFIFLTFIFNSIDCVFVLEIDVSGLSLSKVVIEYVSFFSPDTSGDGLIPILRARKSSLLIIFSCIRSCCDLHLQVPLLDLEYL